MSIRKIDFAEDVLAELEAEAKRLKTTLSGLVNMRLSGLSSAPIRPQSGPNPAPISSDAQPRSGPYAAPTEAVAGPDPAPTGDIGGLSVSWEGGGSSDPVPSSQKKEGSGEAKRRAAEGFPEFWVAYPRKEGKKAAEKAWVASFKTRPPLPDLLLAIREQTTARGWPSQYTPHAATWLNGEKWNDPAAPPNGNGYHPAVPERPYLDPFWRAFFDDPAGEKRTARVARALASQGGTLAPEQRAEVERLDRETP